MGRNGYMATLARALVLLMLSGWVCVAGWAKPAGGGAYPRLTIASPANGATFAAPANVTVNVTANAYSQEFLMDMPMVTLNGQPISDYEVLTALPAGTYHVFATADIYQGGMLLADPAQASATFTVTGPPPRDAAFVSQSVPTTMVVGQSYPVSVQMKNTGSETWTPAASYRLGSQNPHDNTTWGPYRVELPGAVANGQTTTITFTATAPLTAGTYNFQWQMAQDGVAWFGPLTPNQSITVQASTIYGSIDGVANGNIVGWACSTRLNPSIVVHLYVGGPAGTGTMVGAYSANQASEPAVASACLASGTAYRFAIPITPAMVTQHGGKAIYIHGLSPVGAANLTIAGSGAYSIPANQPPVVSMTSPVQGASYNLPANLTLAANASDPDDGIAEVTFYVDDQAVHTSTTAPFLHPVQALVEGTHSYHAVAKDTRGATTTSAKVSITAIRVNGEQPQIPGQVLRTYTYDQHQQLCRAYEPETGATVYGYDGAGNVAWSSAGLPYNTPCDGNDAAVVARKVVRTYDTRNRVATLTFPGQGIGNQVLSYTPDGLLASVTTWNSDLATHNGSRVTNAYAYNQRRLLTGETVQQPGWYAWSAGYAYDGNASLTTQTYPTGLAISYFPNALGQPTQVRDQGGQMYASGVQYYPNGAVKQFTYANGIVHTMDQNVRQLPIRTVDGSAVNFVYNYDRNGNVDAIGDYIQGGGDGSHSRWMTYDGVDRLTAVGSCMFGGDCWHRFTYDRKDNLTSWKLPGVKDYAVYNYDANRLTSIQNSAGATVMGLWYDEQGNLRNKNGQNYSFSYGNRLMEVTGKEYYRYDGHGRRVMAWEPVNGGTILSMYNLSGQFAYQEDGRRSIASENIYLGDDLLVIRERSYFATTYSYKYQHTDALGSPVAVTNEAGQVIERTNYEPYGAAIGKPNYAGIGYTGHVQDGLTGLTYMQQRYYDPQVGRFLSVDPVTAYSNPVGAFNRYWYASNNPYVFKDPDGRQQMQAVLETAHNLAADIATTDLVKAQYRKGTIGGADAIRTIQTFGAPDDGFVQSVRNDLRADAKSLENARRRGVDRAWSDERELVRQTGVGTREWTNAEKAELLKTGRVSGYLGHHINSVMAFPELADEPNNVSLIPRADHRPAHGGNWRNATSGDLLDRGTSRAGRWIRNTMKILHSKPGRRK